MSHLTSDERRGVSNRIMMVNKRLYTLPETNSKSTWKWMAKEDDRPPFLLGIPIFRGEKLVLGSVRIRPHCLGWEGLGGGGHTLWFRWNIKWPNNSWYQKYAGVEASGVAKLQKKHGLPRSITTFKKTNKRLPWQLWSTPNPSIAPVPVGHFHPPVRQSNPKWDAWRNSWKMKHMSHGVL